MTTIKTKPNLTILIMLIQPITSEINSPEKSAVTLTCATPPKH
jgi:hypothetical protein